MSDKEYFAEYTTEELQNSFKRNGRRKGRNEINLAILFEIDRRERELIKTKTKK